MIRYLSLALLVFFASTACQSAMSVEEAKKISAQFVGGPFVPPPRTITDIMAVLDEQRLSNPEAVPRLRARADAPPLATSDSQTLANFYHQRGIAARNLGRAKQALADMTDALRWAPRDTRAGAVPTNTTWYSVVTDLTRLEDIGDYPSIIKYLQKASADLPIGRGMQISLNSHLTVAYAAIGDFSAAHKAMTNARDALAISLQFGVRSWETPEAHAVQKAMWQALVADAEAFLSEARGEFAMAEGLYRQEIRELTSSPEWTGKEAGRTYGIVRARKRLTLVLLHEGRLLEAESEARAGLLHAAQYFGRNTYQAGDAALTLARVMMEQGRFVEAERLNRAVLDILERAGVTDDAVLVRAAHQGVGASLLAQGQWSQALAEFEHVRPVGSPDWGLALVQAGRVAEAIDVFRVGLARSEKTEGPQSLSTAEFRGLLGVSYARSRQPIVALREFRHAVPVLLGLPIESMDEEAATRPMREQRTGLILASYIATLAEITGTQLEREAGLDTAAEAFRAADVARGRSVQRALDASAARASSENPTLAALVREEQDTKKRAEALYGMLANLLAAPTQRQDSEVINELRQQTAVLTERRRRLRESIEREFPAYAKLVSPVPPTLADARASLRPGEALIATYVSEDRLFVWAVPHTGAPAFASRPISATTLASTVTRVRQALDPSASVLDDIPPFEVIAAYDLYRELLEPVKAGWGGAQSLLVVPHGPLAQLPFGLLPTALVTMGPDVAPLFANYRAVPWLIRTQAVTVLPSVGALITLRSLPAGDPTRRAFAGFGDPYFSVEQAQRGEAEQSKPAIQAAVGAETSPSSGSPALLTLAARSHQITLRDLKISKADSVNLARLPRLPDTAAEIRGIALALNADPTRDVFLGARATETAVKTTDLSRYQVIAFATHGLVPGDLDGLTQPALALTAPEVAGTDGDGLLTMEEILPLRLNADWVVLSACNTASGQGAGAEAISGLGRAFFYAGARALLVSNWPVETTSARTLTTDLFRRQAADPRLTRAQTLQQTLNAMIDSGEYVDPQSKQTVFSYAHPIFWAPFTLVGDGGAGGATR